MTSEAVMIREPDRVSFDADIFGARDEQRELVRDSAKLRAKGTTACGRCRTRSRRAASAATSSGSGSGPTATHVPWSLTSIHRRIIVVTPRCRSLAASRHGGGRFLVATDSVKKLLAAPALTEAAALIPVAAAKCDAAGMEQLTGSASTGVAAEVGRVDSSSAVVWLAAPAVPASRSVGGSAAEGGCSSGFSESEAAAVAGGWLRCRLGSSRLSPLRPPCRLFLLFFAADFDGALDFESSAYSADVAHPIVKRAAN